MEQEVTSSHWNEHWGQHRTHQRYTRAPRHLAWWCPPKPPEV